LDKDDACPEVKGIVENKGCPKIEKEEEEILKRAFDNLEFESGRDVIKASSYYSLDELAVLMTKKKEWNIKISGHTDNVGNDNSNMQLSKERSEAVKNYLIQKGVDESRIIALWFGESQPIESNDTNEGRQKNRRVEITLFAYSHYNIAPHSNFD
jgi:outer membrane protein OmpA-like peptidoglycan-associated protein